MEDRTQKPIGGWTIDALKEYFERQIQSSEERLCAKIAHVKEIAAQDHAASQQAIDKSEAATNAKFNSVNEFRAALTDQSDRMMPRVESETRHQNTQDKIEAQSAQVATRFDALSTRMDDLNRRMLLREGAETGTKETKGASLATISIIIAAVGALSGVLGSVLATIMRPLR